MSIVEQLEAAGEMLSPAMRAATLALEPRIREMEARLRLDSTNSSKPPSAEPPDVLRRGEAHRSQTGRSTQPSRCLPSPPAERALSCAVLSGKGCFGSASGHGLVFVERLLTLSETCRQNAVNVLDYLTRAILAHREHGPTLRLLLASLTVTNYVCSSKN